MFHHRDSARRAPRAWKLTAPATVLLIAMQMYVTTVVALQAAPPARHMIDSTLWHKSSDKTNRVGCVGLPQLIDEPSLLACTRRAAMHSLLLFSAHASAGQAMAIRDLGDDEERLIEVLQAGGVAGANLTPVQMRACESLIRQLEQSGGGSQRDQAEGIGSWGSWIGAWDVLYAASGPVAGGPVSPRKTKLRPSDPDVQLTLVQARQFVFGPSNAADDLRGIPVEGGTSTELTYALAPDAAPSLLLTRSGSFTKLADFDYRLDFARPSRLYQLSGTPPSPATATAADTLGVLQPAGGAFRRQITYLSERLWISRGADDDALLVLLRSMEAKALVPPSERPDLTSTCAEAVFVRGQVCRKTGLF